MKATTLLFSVATAGLTHCLVLSVGVAANTADKLRTPPPNVIIVLTDDQGYGDLSCHGNPVLKTPFMDRLHGESVRFTDFHVAPMCTPTRGQLLTGQDALRNAATSVTAGRTYIRQGVPTIGDIFGASDYATGLFGKWHLGDSYPYRPTDRGFTVAKTILGWGFSSAPEFDNDYFAGRFQDNNIPKTFSGYCTDFWFSEAMKWMKDCQEKRRPFLCYLPTNTPHLPAWVAEKYAAPYRLPGLPADFYGMISNIDENLGRLEEFLEQSGLRDNTILVFISDNGGFLGAKVFNSGMRGTKKSLYEGGHRVHCFVRWPNGGLRTPGDVKATVQVQDILPTLLSLCGIKDRLNAQFDGADLTDLLKGQDSLPERMLVVQYGEILKKWDSCVIWNKWRLVNGHELYDIAADPGQETDIAQQHQDVTKQMRDHYEAWWSKLDPSLKEYCPISIGYLQENPVLLTSADWQDAYCDSVQNVLRGDGGGKGAPWNVYVERDGEYEITLSRWPLSRNLALNAPCPETRLTVGTLIPGKALPIAAARLTVAGQEHSRKSAADDHSVVFRINLKRGQKIKIHGWFQDASGKDLCGAYYAYVKYL